MEHKKQEYPDLSPQEFAEDLLLMREGLPLHQPVRKLTLWRSVAALAAVLALFFAVYLSWPANRQHVNQKGLLALKVSAGQKKQLRLPDGSRVWINEGSELKYPDAFTGGTREVFLSGEAYFDIQHDPAKPFIIHTGEVLTTVLGTAFNIREDKHTHLVEVTVRRGKVSVANGRRTLGVLTPNQQISFNTLSNRVIQQKVDAEQIVSWQKTDLRFEDVTFAEAAKQLSERFNVQISFRNEQIRSCRFTGASLTGEKLDEVLKRICDFNKASYQKLPDGSILIDGQGCAN